LVALVAAAASAIPNYLHAQRSDTGVPSPIAVTAITAGSCVPLTNHNGTIYTTVVGVGTPAQLLDVVPDTGSYDFVAVSTMCNDNSCRQHYDRFKANESSTYYKSSENDMRMRNVQMDYGQGGIVVEVDYDNVAFYGTKTTAAPLSAARNVSVELMKEESFAGFRLAPYDGIMGLGKRSETELHTTAFLEDMGVSGFTICLGDAATTGDGIGGRLEIMQTLDVGSPYVDLQTIGQHVWGVPLEGVGVGSEPASAECTAATPCAAIIDSGTTMLTFAPNTTLYLLESIEAGCTEPDCLLTLQDSETCDGKEYDALPSITLALGGATLTLPPSVYMGEMDVDIPVVHRHKIAGIQIPTTRYVEGVRCVPLLSNIEEPTDHGALAILGMPFLRHYATYFDRTSGGIAVAEVAASSELCNQCNAGRPSDALAEESSDRAVASRTVAAAAVDKQAEDEAADEQLQQTRERPGESGSKEDASFWSDVLDEVARRKDSARETARHPRALQPQPEPKRHILPGLPLDARWVMAASSGASGGAATARPTTKAPPIRMSKIRRPTLSGVKRDAGGNLVL